MISPAHNLDEEIYSQSPHKSHKNDNALFCLSRPLPENTKIVQSPDQLIMTFYILQALLLNPYQPRFFSLFAFYVVSRLRGGLVVLLTFDDMLFAPLDVHAFWPTYGTHHYSRLALANNAYKCKNTFDTNHNKLQLTA
jgi:hypothetical protein